MGKKKALELMFNPARLIQHIENEPTLSADTVQSYIRSGAKVNYEVFEYKDKDRIIKTALSVALEKQNTNLKMIEVLLQAGANPNFVSMRFFPKLDFFGKPVYEVGPWGDPIYCVKENTLLMWAIHDGNLPYIHLLLKYQSNPNLAHQDGETPLHYAITKRVNLEIIEALLKAGADPNHIGNKRKKPLVRALEENLSPQTIEALLNAGADANYSDEYGYNILIYTVYSKHPLSIIQLLLKHQANPNHMNKKGESPLYWAIQEQRKPEIIEALLEAGADPNYSNKNGDNALTSAVSFGYPLPTVQLVIKHQVKLNHTNKKRENALHRAIHTKKINIIEFLLQSGINVNQSDNKGNTPLILAIMNECPMLFSQILLEHGANPNHANIKGETALYFSIYTRNICLIQQLIEYQADPNYAHILTQETALHIAIKQQCHFDIIEFLLTLDIDVNAMNQDGHTALSLAFALFDQDATVYHHYIMNLIECNADPNLGCLEGNDILIHCIEKKFPKALIQQLIDHGANLEVKNKKGIPAHALLAQQYEYTFEKNSDLPLPSSPKTLSDFIKKSTLLFSNMNIAEVGLSPEEQTQWKKSAKELYKLSSRLQ